MSIGSTPVVRILRRLWLVALCMAITGLTANVLSVGPASYSAEASLVVPGGGADEPVRASEAQRLAATYAAVIGRDDGVMPVVADTVRRPRAEVEQRLEVANVMGTSVVQLTYTADDPREAVRAVRTVVRLVSGDAPQTPTIAAGTLLPTRVATQARESSRPPAVPIGLLLGLALGILLLVTLERAEPRVDHVGDLEPLVSTPVTALPRTPDALGLLGARWAEHIAPDDTITIVPVLDADVDGAAEVYRQVVHSTAAGGVDSGPLDVPVVRGSLGDAQLVLASSSLARSTDGLLWLTPSTAIVLVVTRGSRLRAVRRSMRALQAADARVLWCVLVPERSWFDSLRQRDVHVPVQSGPDSERVALVASAPKAGRTPPS